MRHTTVKALVRAALNLQREIRLEIRRGCLCSAAEDKAKSEGRPFKCKCPKGRVPEAYAKLHTVAERLKV